MEPEILTGEFETLLLDNSGAQEGDSMSFCLLLSAFAYCSSFDFENSLFHCRLLSFCPCVFMFASCFLVHLFYCPSLQSYLLTHHYILIVCVLFVPWFTLSALLCNCWSYNLLIFLYLQISVCCVLNLLISEQNLSQLSTTNLTI